MSSCAGVVRIQECQFGPVARRQVDQAIDLLADAGHHPQNIGRHLRFVLL